jgi:hypothetical protein
MALRFYHPEAKAFLTASTNPTKAKNPPYLRRMINQDTSDTLNHSAKSVWYFEVRSFLPPAAVRSPERSLSRVSSGRSLSGDQQRSSPPPFLCAQSRRRRDFVRGEPREKEKRDLTKNLIHLSSLVTPAARMVRAVLSSLAVARAWYATTRGCAFLSRRDCIAGAAGWDFDSIRRLARTRSAARRSS